MPRVSSGNQGCGRHSAVRRLGGGHPFNGSLSELFRVLVPTACLIVGDHAGDVPPAPGANPTAVPMAEERSIKHGILEKIERDLFDHSEGRCDLDLTVGLLAAADHAGENLGQAEKTDESNDELDARLEFRKPEGEPKVPAQRGDSDTAQQKPKAPPISPLMTEPVEMVAMMVKPKIPSQKYSGGPNLSETSASGGRLSPEGCWPLWTRMRTQTQLR
jgi:hypothetical protein